MFRTSGSLYSFFKKEIAIFFYISFIVTITFGCAAKTSTKDLPVTVIESAVKIPKGINLNYPLIFTGFRIDNTEIVLKHHEGILQVEQPSYFGPDEYQKELIKSSAIQLAKYGFVKELVRSGFKVVESAGMDNCSYILSGNISRIVINTYGYGFKGFGSAGDYWECYITFKNLILRDFCSDFRLFVPEITSYAKLKGSPIKIYGGLLHALNYFIRLAMNPLSGNVPSYEVSVTSDSTVEVASRIAAQKFLETLTNNKNH